MDNADEPLIWAELDGAQKRERLEYLARTRRNGGGRGRVLGMRRSRPNAGSAGGRRLSGGLKNFLKREGPVIQQADLEMSQTESGLAEDDDTDYSVLAPDDDCFLPADEDDGYAPVPDLDVYFSNMYKFYHGRGLPTMIARGVASLVILGFTVAFSAFLMAFVDWPRLLSCHDEASCLDLGHYVSARALREPSFMHLLVLCYCALFALYWVYCLAQLWTGIRDALAMYKVYTERLRISTRELQTMPWSEVVRRFLNMQKTGSYRVTIHKRDLTEHDIASRIMRRENYLIALINKDVMDLHLPLPFFGAAGRGSAAARTRRQFLTRSLEWSLQLCILSHLFNAKFLVRSEFLTDVKGLRRRFIALGLAQLALLPFLLLFMVMYFFLQNAQEWHASRNYLGPREWSPLAQWTFREFNELPHIFERRMEGSYQHATDYLNQFPKPVLSSVMRIVRFLSGAFVAVLLLLTLLDESILLYVKLWDRNLLWFAGVFSAVYAFSRGLAPQAAETVTVTGDDIEETMLRVAAHTHFLPERWRGRTHTQEVRDEVMGMFQYKAQLFLQELLSVLFAPVVLCVSLPGCAEDIVAFVGEHSVNVEGIGSVCSFSLFDFDRYGNELYAAPAAAGSEAGSGRASSSVAAADGGGGASSVRSAGQNTPAGQDSPARGGWRGGRDVTENGKMEKSFLNFKANYPEWECGPSGQQMIARLANFQQAYVQQQSFMHMPDDVANPEEGNAAADAGSIAGGRHLVLPIGGRGGAGLPPPHSPLLRSPVQRGSQLHHGAAPEPRVAASVAALPLPQQSSILAPSGLGLASMGMGLGRSTTQPLGGSLSLSPSMVPSLHFSMVPSVLAGSQMYASRAGLGGSTLGMAGGAVGGVEVPPECNDFYWLEKYYAAHRQGGALPGIPDYGGASGSVSGISGGGGGDGGSGGGGNGGNGGNGGGGVGSGGVGSGGGGVGSGGGSSGGGLAAGSGIAAAGGGGAGAGGMPQVPPLGPAGGGGREGSAAFSQPGGSGAGAGQYGGGSGVFGQPGGGGSGRGFQDDV